MTHCATCRRPLPGERLRYGVITGKGREVRNVCVDDILYCEATNKCVDIVMTNGRRHVTTFTLQRLAISLGAQFVQISRECIVRRDAVRRTVHRSSGWMADVAGTLLPISRRRMREMREHLKDA